MKKIILIIFLLIILPLGYYMVIFEPNNIQLEKEIITIENLPEEFNGIRIVHLTDFHSYWFGSREKRVLEIVKKFEPDFIFITGDFVDRITRNITDRDLSSVRSFWQELGKRYQGRIFGVLGNHDHNGGIVRGYLKRAGIPILDNENKKIFVNNQFIYLIGVDDVWINRGDLTRAMKGIENDIPKILLSHSPDIIYEAAEQKIDLVLSGHTHGGQVVIPFFGPLWIPSEFSKRYVSGLFRVDSTYLYVNRGVGTSMLPIRFNCPPEITLIKIKNQ